MRDVPRAQYAAKPERRNVTVETRTGERLRFARARFSADSMVGSRAGQGETSLALEDVNRIRSRQVDWYRTGLIGGIALAAVLAATLSRSNDETPPGPSPPPCPRCP